MTADRAPVGLLLAAGRGSRFDAAGRAAKLLASSPTGPRVGRPLAEAAAMALREAVPRIVAVVRPADSPQQRSLHAVLRAAGCELVVNTAADDGIGRSIATGVAATAEAPGWLIALADMPAVATATIAAVRDALAQGALAAVPVHAGRRGHPVGFAAALRSELLALDGDEGARRVLAAHPPTRVAVDDAGCLLDLDAPEDFEHARRAAGQA